MNAATGALVPDAVFCVTSCPTPRRRSRRCRRRACVCWRRRASTTNARSRFRPTVRPRNTRGSSASLTSQLAAGTLTRATSPPRSALQSRGGVYRRRNGTTCSCDADGCSRSATAAPTPSRAHLETCLVLAALGAGNGAVLVSGHGAFDADAAAHAAQAAMREVGGAPGRKRRWRLAAAAPRAPTASIARSGASPGSGRPAPSPASPRGSPRRSAGICLSKCPSRRSRWSSPSPRPRRRRAVGRAAGERPGAGGPAPAPRRRGRHAQVGPPRARDGDGGDPRDRDLVPRRARVRRGEGRDARRTGPLERGGRSERRAPSRRLRDRTASKFMTDVRRGRPRPGPSRRRAWRVPAGAPRGSGAPGRGLRALAGGWSARATPWTPRAGVQNARDSEVSEVSEAETVEGDARRGGAPT